MSIIFVNDQRMRLTAVAMRKNTFAAPASASASGTPVRFIGIFAFPVIFRVGHQIDIFSNRNSLAAVLLNILNPCFSLGVKKVK